MSFYANPYSPTTYANDVKFSNFDAGMTAILNIGYASYSRGNYTPKKNFTKTTQKNAPAGRTFVDLRIQLICILNAEIDGNAT